MGNSPGDLRVGGEAMPDYPRGLDSMAGSSPRPEHSASSGYLASSASSHGRFDDYSRDTEPLSSVDSRLPNGAGYAGSSVSTATSTSTPAPEAARANKRGVELLRLNQYDEAVQQFRTALSYEPGSVQILNNIGLAYAKKQDFHGAYEWYEKAYLQDMRDVETLFSLAWVERKRQRFGHAKELFQKVLGMQPDHVKALYLLGDIHKMAQDYDGAFQYFERLVRLDPSSIDGRISLAQCYEQNKQFQQAVQIYEHALQLAPKRLDVAFYLGRSLFASRQFADALVYLDRVPDADARGFDARVHMAKAYRALRDSERAISTAERAFQIKAHAEVLHFIGEEHLENKDDARAERSFLRALEMEPAHTPSLREIVQLLQRQNRWSEADRYSQRLRDCESQGSGLLRPAVQDPGATFRQGEANLRMGKHDEAISAFEQVVKARPEDALALEMLATTLQKVGRDSEAIPWLKRLLDLRPGDYKCVLNLAKLLAAQGKAGAEQALMYLKCGLQSGPSSEAFRDMSLQAAQIHSSLGSHREAQQSLESLLRDCPNDVEVLGRLATLSMEAQDSSRALQCHRRLEELDRLTAPQRLSYGDLLMGQGHIQEARRQYDHVLREQPSNVGALLKLGASWRQDSSRENHLEEARKMFERALQLQPGNADALEGAAYACRKMNDMEAAIPLYQACLKARPTAEGPLYYLGDILYRQHRHAECQHYLSRLVSTNCTPDYRTGALYLLAKSHVSLDEYVEAEKQVRAGLEFKANHPHFLFILGLVKNRVADYHTSITILESAVRSCRSSEDRSSGNEELLVECHDWLAQAHERLQDYKRAMNHLDIALQKDPSHVSSLITKGQVHIQLKQLDQAETALRRALAVEKNHAMALVRLGYCKLLMKDHGEATQLFNRSLQQRCGTVALPRSIKGMARVYLALTLMATQDVDGAMFQLTEARKNHRAFSDICTGAKDIIVSGECDGLVDQLHSISNLDLNKAQAWQLVHLMAKELELDLQGDAGPKATGRGLGENASKPAGGTSQQFGFNGGHAHAAAPLGAPAASSAPSSDARRWSQATPAEDAGRRAWTQASSAEEQQPQRRQWSHAADAEAAAQANRRAWTQPDEAAAPPVKEPEKLGGGGTRLKLERHEQIEYDQLTRYECLGTGGFGAVYRGCFRGQEVAIKKLFVEDGGSISPLQLEELEKEIATLRNYRHPRLVAFVGACLRPPDLCIVTEFMNGGSLHHLLHKAKAALMQTQQIKMAGQICEGVSFLHCLQPPVVHRDLKSLNIILDVAYNAKLCDFGLTQCMDNTHISLKDGGNGGSPRYMAPECYDSKGKITEKVDVWALGCILIEVFGGPLPYDDCVNIQQIVAKVLIEKQVPHVPHFVPREVRAVVEDCFHFDLTQRTTAQDVYARIRILRPA
eukprot:TRINITY_DN27051_c0_g3_i1.p1 TRINITY_DN27051_c0_g3~~TRINITY_DN27051_c0_g3_i1.p1  ORF type:complete len:1405 (+),score=254.77 TRINITY_DN27051_c0_g3_i1:285-4499(+)